MSSCFSNLIHAINSFYEVSEDFFNQINPPPEYNCETDTYGTNNNINTILYYDLTYLINKMDDILYN